MSTSSTDSPDDLKKDIQPYIHEKTPAEIENEKKFAAFFSTDLNLIAQTIHADRQYRNKIDPHVIRRVNEQTQSLKWRDFKYSITSINANEYDMIIMYQNIFHKDPRIHRILQKNKTSIKDDEALYLGQWMMSNIRINAELDGLFPGENLYR
jgi:hypothetical protein